MRFQSKKAFGRFLIEIQSNKSQWKCIFKDKIKADYDAIMEKRKVDIEKKRAEARKAEEESKYEELKGAADEETT